MTEIPKLGRLEDRSMISGTIRGYLDNLDEFLDEEEAAMHPQKRKKDETWDFEQIHLGSRQRPTSISSFIDNEDPAFMNFPRNLAQCIHNILMQEYLSTCEKAGTFEGITMPPFPSVKTSDLVSTIATYNESSFQLATYSW